MNRVLKYVLGVLLLILTQTLFAQKVSPFYEDGKRKTTEELVDEIIFKLT